jgi:hypothetical protein
MNKFHGTCLGPGGVYAYEAMWSIAGRRIFWDSRVSLAGEVVGTPGGIINGSGERHVSDMVEAAVRNAIEQGMRRRSEQQW